MKNKNVNKKRKYKYILGVIFRLAIICVVAFCAFFWIKINYLEIDQIFALKLDSVESEFIKPSEPAPQDEKEFNKDIDNYNELINEADSLNLGIWSSIIKTLPYNIDAKNNFYIKDITNENNGIETRVKLKNSVNKEILIESGDTALFISGIKRGSIAEEIRAIGSKISFDIIGKDQYAFTLCNIEGKIKIECLENQDKIVLFIKLSSKGQVLAFLFCLFFISPLIYISLNKLYKIIIENKPPFKLPF